MIFMIKCIHKRQHFFLFDHDENDNFKDVALCMYIDDLEEIFYVNLKFYFFDQNKKEQKFFYLNVLRSNFMVNYLNY